MSKTTSSSLKRLPDNCGQNNMVTKIIQKKIEEVFNIDGNCNHCWQKHNILQAQLSFFKEIVPQIEKETRQNVYDEIKRKFKLHYFCDSKYKNICLEDIEQFIDKILKRGKNKY